MIFQKCYFYSCCGNPTIDENTKGEDTILWVETRPEDDREEKKIVMVCRECYEKVKRHRGIL